MNGPSATAPKMHMFMITAVSRSLFGRIADRERRHRGDQQQARAQPLDHTAGDVHAGILCRGRQDRADHEQRRVAEQHPALREVLGELDGQHRAHRVGGVRQARSSD